MEKQPIGVIIPNETMAHLRAYLGQQPHDGVNALIVELQQVIMPYYAPEQPEQPEKTNKDG